MSATASHDSASADVLGGDEERPALGLEPGELVPDRLAQDRVDARGGLVEQEQRRLVDERAGELEAPLHAAGELAGPAAARLPQLDQLEHLADAPPAAPDEHPEQRRDEVDVLVRGEVGVERELLGHVADLLAGRPAEAARVLAQHLDFAVIGVEGAGDHPDRRRLAGARRADDAEDRAGRHREVDAEHAGAVAEVAGRVAEDHERLAADGRRSRVRSRSSSPRSGTSGVGQAERGTGGAGGSPGSPAGDGSAWGCTGSLRGGRRQTRPDRDPAGAGLASAPAREPPDASTAYRATLQGTREPCPPGESPA